MSDVRNPRGRGWGGLARLRGGRIYCRPGRFTAAAMHLVNLSVVLIACFQSISIFICVTAPSVVSGTANNATVSMSLENYQLSKSKDSNEYFRGRRHSSVEMNISCETHTDNLVRQHCVLWSAPVGDADGCVKRHKLFFFFFLAQLHNNSHQAGIWISSVCLFCTL